MKLLKVHRWIGIIFGLLICVQGLTGMAVGFRDELNRVVHPSAMVVPPSPTQASLQQIYDAAHGLREGARVSRIEYPAEPDDAYLVRVEGPGDDDPMIMASFDPGTGQMLRAGTLMAWPIEWLYFLHYTLLNGDTGERFVGMTGLAILGMAVIGFLVWWPGLKTIKAALKVKFSAGTMRALRDLHRTGGAIAAIVLIVTAFTGVSLAWKPWIEPSVYALGGAREVPVPAPLMKSCPEPRPLEDSVAAARARKNGETIKNVRFPGKYNGAIMAVYFRAVSNNPRATDYVWVDTCSAQALASKEAATALPGNLFFDWLLTVHSGEWLGIVGRIVALIGATALAGFGLTGYVLWFGRKRKTKRAAS